MQIELSIAIIICLLVILIGIFANIGGFGGGIILIPILTLFFGFPLKIVIGTVLSSLFLPALVGVIFAARRNEINYKIAIIIEIPTVLGIFVGSKVSEFLSENQLKLVFGIIAFTVSLLMLFNSRTYNEVETISTPNRIWLKITELQPILREQTDNYDYKVSIPFAIVSGLFIGILAGLLGISGGWLKAPIMIVGFSIPPVIASGTALFMILITSLTGGLIHFYSGNWDLELFILLTGSLSVGSIIGDRMKSNMKSNQIAFTLAIILIFISLFTILDVII